MAETATRRTAPRAFTLKSSNTQDGIRRAQQPEMDQRRQAVRLVAALVGESLREVAVLIVVFAPLDLFVQGRFLTPHAAELMMVIVGTLFTLGVFLQVISRWKEWKD